MKSLAAAAVLVVLAAGTAAADPVLDRVSSVVAKGRRLDITVETTLTATGVVFVQGNVNGVPVEVNRSAKAGHHVYKVKVDPARFGLRKLTTAVHFDFTVGVRETASAVQPSQPVTATIPVPCVVLPGFGNEATPGGFAAFATALNVAAGGVYTTSGGHATLVVKEYPSRTKSLAALGKSVGPVVKKALKGTAFAKADLVGYSYGGIVARSFLTQGGSRSVRRCVFLATPNLGLPVAYAAVGLSESGALDQFLGGNPALATLAEQLLSPDAKQALRNLYPTYPWVLPDNFVTRTIVKGALGDPSTPLTTLNAVAPPAGVLFDAFFYTSTPLGEFGTVDTVNLEDLNLTGQLDPTKLATGSGDGVAPAHSVTMDEVASWHAVITPHDAGVGTHVTIQADPAVIAGIAAVLAQ